MLADIRFVHLVNVILQESVFPELLGKKAAQPQAIADEVVKLLQQDQSNILLKLKQTLQTPKPPSQMAADKVLQLISAPPISGS